jgi:hypothetical protein
VHPSYLLAAGLSLTSLASMSHAAIIANFDSANYVITNQGLARGPGFTTGNYDGGGTNNDMRDFVTFSQSAALSPASNYFDSTGTGTGPVFYGGYEAYAYNTATAITRNANSVLNGTPNDFLQVARTNASDATGGRAAAVFMFPVTSTELGSGSTFELRSRAQTSSSLVPLTGRFLVQQGGNLYLTNSTINGPTGVINSQTLTLTGSETFALYDPATSLNFNQSAATFTTLDLTAVTAVGFYFENDAFASGGATRFEVNADRFVVNTVPEPSTLSLIGLSIGALLLRRRRRV